MIKKIVITSYNHDWPKMFEAEAIKIREALGDLCIAVHHIGSTGGYSAKPVIDIIVVVKEPEKTIQPLESLGFKYKGEYDICNLASILTGPKELIQIFMFMKKGIQKSSIICSFSEICVSIRWSD